MLIFGKAPDVSEGISEHAYLISFVCHFYFICSTTFTFLQLTDNRTRSQRAQRSAQNATPSVR